MKNDALKKATDARDQAAAALAELHGRRDALAAERATAQADQDRLKAQHARFVLGKGDPVAPGALVAADTLHRQLGRDLETVGAAIGEAEKSLVGAEVAAASQLREAWYEIDQASQAKMIEAAITVGWLGWRARQCSVEPGVDFNGYLDRIADAAKQQMWPTILPNEPRAECPTMPLPTRFQTSTLIDGARRSELLKFFP